MRVGDFRRFYRGFLTGATSPTSTVIRAALPNQAIVDLEAN